MRNGYLVVICVGIYLMGCLGNMNNSLISFNWLRLYKMEVIKLACTLAKLGG